MIWFRILVELFSLLIIIYSVVLISLNICLGLFSLRETKQYVRKNTPADYNLLASSPYAPSLSIIAPAYNEAFSIIQNVRSLLSIYYNNLEIIVVNDGSVDNSLKMLIEVYQLKKINELVPGKLQAR